MEFSSKQNQQLESLCIKAEEINRQLYDFENGFSPINLVRAATINDGIKAFDRLQTEEFIKLFDSEKNKYTIKKFVPSSGAATRMMKDLFSFFNEYKDEKTTPVKNFPVVCQTIEHIKEFAFYDLLEKKMQQEGLSIDRLLETEDYLPIIDFILNKKGLSYGSYPKAWILFHKTSSDVITPFEEHLKEAGEYALTNNEANIEFSIIEENLQGFETLKQEFEEIFSKKYQAKFNISFSFQKHSTDTVAVNKDNSPLTDENGNFVFRPAGHGALISNINELNEDIIFIKNIDNVSSRYFTETVTYKKLLGGVLIQTKQKIDGLLARLDKNDITKQELVSIYNTVKKQLGFPQVEERSVFHSDKRYKQYLHDFLNRPLRVCGMVKNTGEPGGGPFWIEKRGEQSLQIVEKAQVDMGNSVQKNIFMNATHFNPVDLVLSIKDYKGKKFNLLKYIDPQTGFISEKSYMGNSIKAMERPGLWNGAMSNWLTVFVEVPITTFNPVKILNDLLKPAHQ